MCTQAGRDVSGQSFDSSFFFGRSLPTGTGLCARARDEGSSVTYLKPSNQFNTGLGLMFAPTVPG